MTFAPPAPPPPSPAPPRDERQRENKGATPAQPVVSQMAIAVISAAALAAASLVAALPWLRGYQQGAAYLTIPLAALAPVAITAVLVLWKDRQLIETYGANLISLVIVWIGLAGGRPTLIWNGLVVSPHRLLGDTLPFTTSPWLLIFPVTTTWILAAVATELQARFRRTGISMAVILGSFVLAYALVSDAPGDDLWQAALLFGLIGAIALTQSGTISSIVAASSNVTTNKSEGDTGSSDLPAWYRPWERAAAGALIIIALALVAALLVPVLPGLHNKPGHLGRKAHINSASAGNPLAAIEQLRDLNPTKPPTKMVTVNVSRPSNGYFSLAAFDNYDGAIWSFDRTYQPTGGSVPPPSPGHPDTAGPVIKQNYRVLKPAGPKLPFVPYLNRPSLVSGLPFDADSASGTLVPLKPPAAHNSYSVSSQTPSLTTANVPPGSQGAPGAGHFDLNLPLGSRDDLVGTFNYLYQITNNQSPPNPATTNSSDLARQKLAYMSTVVSALQANDTRVDPVTGKNTPQLLGATSLAEVAGAIVDQHSATPEQFATFVAVVARALGLPARVVTGYRAVASPKEVFPAGAHTLTNKQAWTWAEIGVKGQGWVVADATPVKTATPNPNQAPVSGGGGSSPTTTAPKPPPITTPQNVQGPHPPAPHTTIPIHHHHGTSAFGMALLMIGLLIGLLLLLAAIAAAIPVIQRSMRRKGTPREQVAGAWLDVIDTLGRAGVGLKRSATCLDVTQSAWYRFGPQVGEHVYGVGQLADEAVCSSRQPAAQDANAAWERADEVRKAVTEQTPKSQQIRGLFPFAPRSTETPLTGPTPEPETTRTPTGVGA